MIDYLYYYKAHSTVGKKHRGFLFSSDLRQLKHITQLKELRLQSAKRIPIWLGIILVFICKIRKKYRTGSQSRSVFFRHLANLIKSGQSIQKAAESMIKEEKNKIYLRSLSSLQESLNLGRDLVVSIQEAFFFLPQEYQLLLTGCSDSKSICRIFLSVSSLSDRKQNMTSSIARMSIVFLFILIATAGAFAFYTKIWLFTDRLGFLFDYKYPPAPYELFYQIFSGQIATNWSYLIGLLIAFAIIALIRYQPRLHLLWKKVALRIPIFGEGIRARTASSLFFYLELQAQAGQSLQQSLTAAVSIMRRTPFYNELKQLSNDLIEGRSFTDAIKDLRIFSSDEKSLLLSSFSNQDLQASLLVIRQYLDRKLQTRRLLVKESIRFIYISALVVLYCWAIYTYLYRTHGFVFW